MPNMIVQVSDSAWQDESEDPQSMTRRIVGALETFLDHSSALDASRLTGEITVRFAGDDEVRQLNAQFRDKDVPTNVLSFPAQAMPGQDDPSLGDVILARGTIAREAAEQGKSFGDHAVHLIVHGVLHLAGFDHDTDEAAADMEQHEREILAQLSIADPYALPEVHAREGAHGH